MPPPKPPRPAPVAKSPKPALKVRCIRAHSCSRAAWRKAGHARPSAAWRAGSPCTLKGCMFGRGPMHVQALHGGQGAHVCSKAAVWIGPLGYNYMVGGHQKVLVLNSASTYAQRLMNGRGRDSDIMDTAACDNAAPSPLTAHRRRRLRPQRPSRPPRPRRRRRLASHPSKPLPRSRVRVRGQRPRKRWSRW